MIEGYIYNYQEYEEILTENYSVVHDRDIDIDYRGYYKGIGVRFCYNNGQPYFVSDLSKAPYYKVQDLKIACHLHDMKLLQALNNKYIPIYDESTKELLFGQEDFNKLRRKMSGLKEYDTEDFIFSNNLLFQGIDEIMDSIQSNFDNIARIRPVIVSRVKQIIEQLGLTQDNDDKAYSYEFIDTGSTSRGTNLPSEPFDFDFGIRLDLGTSNLNRYSSRRLNNVERMKFALTDVLNGGFKFEPQFGSRMSSMRLRLKKVAIEYEDENNNLVTQDFDIDFSFFSNSKDYISTGSSLDSRLEQIRIQDEEKYRMILANIMYAKKVLKESLAYKPYRSDKNQGGMGGVGIENWILQNGGSFIDASESFVEVAKKYIDLYNVDLSNINYYSNEDTTTSAYKAFIAFQTEYAVFDFGKSHEAVSKGNFPYDNFIMRNMRVSGFLKMFITLQKQLNYLENLGYIQNKDYNTTSISL